MPINDQPAVSLAALMAGVDAMVRDVTAITMAIAKMERSIRDVACRATLTRLSLACREFVDRIQANRPAGL